jgi:proton-translocating NADH-quinone oxidoreductase chain M
MAFLINYYNSFFNIANLVKVILIINIITIILSFTFMIMRSIVLGKYSLMIKNNKNNNNNKNTSGDEDVFLLSFLNQANDDKFLEDQNKKKEIQSQISNDVNYFWSNFFNFYKLYFLSFFNEENLKKFNHEKKNYILIKEQHSPFFSTIQYLILRITQHHYIKYFILFVMFIYFVFIIIIFYIYITLQNQNAVYPLYVELVELWSNKNLFLINEIKLNKIYKFSNYVTYFEIYQNYSEIINKKLNIVTPKGYWPLEMFYIKQMQILEANNVIEFNKNNHQNYTLFILQGFFEPLVEPLIYNNTELKKIQHPIFFKLLSNNNEYTNIGIFSSLTITWPITFLRFKLTGLSLPLLWLTTLILLLCTFYLLSLVFNDNLYKINNFLTDHLIYKYFLFIHILHFCLYITFLVTNILVFYIFFEIILIPMLLLILSDGYNTRKVKANYYFIFFTIVGSFFLLAGIFELYNKYHTLDFNFILEKQRHVYLLESIYPHFEFIKELKSKYLLSYNQELFIFLCFFLGFCIKIPVFPFHIWLPEAHAEASTVGSVILASLLLKLGTYGLLNFCLPLVKYSFNNITTMIAVFTSLGIFYVSIITITQYDIKKIVAYLSVIHMGILVISLLQFNGDAIIGSIFLMITHGLTSAGFFFLIGFYYSRTHTRDLNLINNTLLKTPLFRTYFFWLNLCNVSFPGTASFISEMFIWFGLIRENNFFAFFVLITTIFAYVISFWLMDRFFHKNENYIHEQEVIKSALKQIYLDLRIEEIFILSVLLFFSIFFGLFPSLLINVFYSYSISLYIFIITMM